MLVGGLDEDCEKPTELAELPIGQQKSAQGSQAIKSLIAVLLSGAFVDWCAWSLGLTRRDLAGLPHEVLQQIPLVLGQKQDFGLLQDVFEVGDEMFTFR